MFLLQTTLLCCALIATSVAKEISGVFIGFESLTWDKAGNYAYQGPQYPTWNAVLDWSLDGTTTSPGDTFTLIMPCVFKFTTSATSVDLTANGITYATCDLHAGEEFTTYSSLTCTVTDSLSSVHEAMGTVTIPLAFNVGGSGSSVDIADSTCFTAGTNTVTFQDGDTSISTQAYFAAATGSSSGLLYFQRSVPSLNKLNALAILPDCPNGYTSGTLGFSSSNSRFLIDCSSAEAYITNLLNSWNYPTSADSFSYTQTCTSKSFQITFNNIPAGYRPYIAALVQAPSSDYKIDYTAKYQCAGSSQKMLQNRSLGQAIQIVTQIQMVL